MKINMVTILWLLLLPHILYCWHSTLQMDWYERRWSKYREWKIYCFVCTLSLTENLTFGTDFALPFCGLRQRIVPNYVAHVQQDSFSSFNQSNHCFLASLPMVSSLPTLPILRTSRRRCFCLGSNKRRPCRYHKPFLKGFYSCQRKISFFVYKERKTPYLSISIVRIQEFYTFPQVRNPRQSCRNSRIPAVHSSPVPLRSWIPVECASTKLDSPSQYALEIAFFPYWKNAPICS